MVLEFIELPLQHERPVQILELLELELKRVAQLADVSVPDLRASAKVGSAACAMDDCIAAFMQTMNHRDSPTGVMSLTNFCKPRQPEPISPSIQTHKRDELQCGLQRAHESGELHSAQESGQLQHELQRAHEIKRACDARRSHV